MKVSRNAPLSITRDRDKGFISAVLLRGENNETYGDLCQLAMNCEEYGILVVFLD